MSHARYSAGAKIQPRLSAGLMLERMRELCAGRARDPFLLHNILRARLAGSLQFGVALDMESV